MPLLSVTLTNICPPSSLTRVPALSAFRYQPVHIQQRSFLLLNHFAFFFLNILEGGAGERELCVSEGEYL